MRSKRLNKVTKVARILNLRFLDYLPCTCKIPGQNGFGRNFFIYEPIFKIFMALFTTFGKQKDDNIIFVCGCFRTKICKKVVSKNWCKESRPCDIYRSLTVYRKIFGTSSYGEDARACACISAI